MLPRFVSFLFTFLLITPLAQRVKFKTTIDRIIYTLDTETKTATINRVYVFLNEDRIVKLQSLINLK